MRVYDMKQLFFGIVWILLLQGCTSKVEIPIKHAGVVTNQEQVKAEVLKSGVHAVDFGSDVVVYEISPTNLQIEFDVLFSDASAGNLKVALDFNPIPDSLASFYKKYQSIYITPIIDQRARAAVRQLLFKYKPDELTKEELRKRIIKAITEDPSISNYVYISDVETIELGF